MAKPKSLPTFPLLTATFLVFSTLFLLSGRIPTPFTTSYSASKFALDGFFTSLRHELTMQKKNVSVTLCILGLIDTATALENTRCVFGGYRSRGRACICLDVQPCRTRSTRFKAHQGLTGSVSFQGQSVHDGFSRSRSRSRHHPRGSHAGAGAFLPVVAAARVPALGSVPE